MHIKKETQICYDMVIIGGGINGVGIANDAAGRGLSVFLCEKDDLAQHTSSASSKLIHGGLRYLEHKEFRLVREALAEREILLAKAPHIIRPMRFIMPHRPHLRPAWLIRSGLFLYDYLGKRKVLPSSENIYFEAKNSPLKSHIRRGFEYSDCIVDDSRLVVLNAIQARNHGAKIETRTHCTHAERECGYWKVILEHEQKCYEIKAKVLVNAAGPWVAKFIQQNLSLKSDYAIRLIRGSHIIVPRLFKGNKVFILQNEDQRIVFVIPYLNQYTLIGTTDHEYAADPAKVKITDQEINYLINVCNAHFKTQINQADIVSTFSGVRPLCDDESNNPSVITRDYTIALSQGLKGDAALLSVFGGKLTTYRKLAESVLLQLKPFFPKMKSAWTEKTLLPGAEKFISVEQLCDEILDKVTDIPVELALRWAHAYGSNVWSLLGHSNSIQELGQYFGCGLYAQEVDFLVGQEWAITSEDILKRRTKLYLDFSLEQIHILDEYLFNLHQKRKQDDAA